MFLPQYNTQDYMANRHTLKQVLIWTQCAGQIFSCMYELLSKSQKPSLPRTWDKNKNWNGLGGLRIKMQCPIGMAETFYGSSPLRGSVHAFPHPAYESLTLPIRLAAWMLPTVLHPWTKAGIQKAHSASQELLRFHLILYKSLFFLLYA